MNAAASVYGADFTYGDAWVLADYPKGCFSVDAGTGTILAIRANKVMGNGVFFNAHAVGAANYAAKLLCLTGTAAPTRNGYTYPPTGAPCAVGRSCGLRCSSLCLQARRASHRRWPVRSSVR